VELGFYELVGARGICKIKMFKPIGICIAVNKLRGMIMHLHVLLLKFWFLHNRLLE